MSTMIKGADGKIIAQAGFVPVEAVAFAPLIVFKVAAIAAVGKAGFTKLRLDDMRKRFGKSNFMRLFDMASYADNLYHGMKIMEALLNMRMLDTSYNRAGHIEELWREIAVQGQVPCAAKGTR